MRILIVNQYAIPSSRAGGTRHVALSRALADRGHEVVILAGASDYTTGQAFAEAGRLTATDHPGVSFLWGPVAPYRGNGPRRAWSMLRFASAVGSVAGRRLPWRPDVVVGSSPHPFAALAAQIWAVRRSIPFVLEIRDVWPDTLIDSGQISAGHPFVRVLRSVERRLYKRADGIVTLLPGAGEYLQRCGVRPDRISVVPNGVDDAVLARAPAPTPVRPPFVAVYAGAHGYFNGLETLVRAGRQLDDRGLAGTIVLRLIGDGPEKPKLMALARDLGVRSVEFLPPVPKSAVPDVLASAHIGVLHLRRSEVFRWGVSPNKLFDYMAAGRPVVFAVSTALNPVAASGAGVSVEPEDPTALADALTGLMALSGEDLAALGARGREFVASRHAIGALAAEFEAALQAAVANRIERLNQSRSA